MPKFVIEPEIPGGGEHAQKEGSRQIQLQKYLLLLIQQQLNSRCGVNRKST